MYKLLDDVLLEEISSDAWYDDGCIYANELLTKFKDGDWIELKKLLEVRDEQWKIKLAYVIDSEFKVNGLRILLSLIETQNNELIAVCLDALRSFKIKQFKGSDDIEKIIMEKVDSIYYTNTIPMKVILEDLLKKINFGKAEIKNYKQGIPKFPKLEKVVPLPFHEKMNQFIIDYKELSERKFWEKYELNQIWFDLNDYIVAIKKLGTLGKVIINVLVDFGFILQLDYKEDIADYEVENFWGDEPVKLVQFDIGDDQEYYAYIPQSTQLESIFDVKIYDVEVDELE